MCIEFHSAGHDCNWYQNARRSADGICGHPAVKQACPAACGILVRCFKSNATKTQWYKMGNRIMPVESNTQEKSVLCTRQGFDAEAECKKNVGKKWPSPAVSQTPDSTDLERGTVDLTDCIDVSKKFDKHCQYEFETPTQDLQNMHALVQESGAVTIMFWFRLTQEDMDPTFDDEIIFYRSVFPQRRLLKMALVKGGQFELYGTCETKSTTTDVASPLPFKAGEWFFIAASWSTGGSFRLTVNSMTVEDKDIEPAWCVPSLDGAGHRDFIQALEFRGGDRWDVSPIAVTPRLVPIGDLQSLYSTRASKLRLRTGARATDIQRMTSRIQYRRHPYVHPVALIAPPILMQERSASTDTCISKLGKVFQHKTWSSAVNGITCSLPFQCDDDLLSAPAKLLSCRKQTQHDEFSMQQIKFFGSPARNVSGQWVFVEFLQSIMESEYLVREGQPLQTSSYFDSQTLAVTIAMTTYSAEYGIASMIEIKADFTNGVDVSYAVRHLQSLEGDELQTYTVVISVGLLVACIILLEKIFTLRYLFQEDFGHEEEGDAVVERDEKDPSMESKEELPCVCCVGNFHEVVEEHPDVWVAFVADVLIQFALPVVYFSLRYSQIRSSEQMMQSTIGDQGGLCAPVCSPPFLACCRFCLSVHLFLVNNTRTLKHINISRRPPCCPVVQ